MKPAKSSRKRAEPPIHLIEAAMRHVSEAVVITTTELDPPGPEIVYVNEGFCRMTGYAAEEVLGQTPRILQGPKTDRAELDRLRRHLSRGKSFVGGETINYRKDGSEYVLDWHIVPLRDDAGEVTHWLAGQRDITKRRALEESLRYQALHDPLTDLPNRTLFMDRLEHTLSLATRRPRLSAVLFVDLDDFKVVNDSLGHEAGDALLVTVAERLRSYLRPEDTVARFGGDEFAVLLENIMGVSDATRAAGRIVEGLREPFVVEGREVFISPSIGIVLATSSREQLKDLLRKADIAMYVAKGKGKGRYEVFNSTMNVQALERLEVEHDLRRAIERGELRVHYQPKVLVKTGRIVGTEALVRWEHPERGLLQPATFIPIAEETGLIVPLGRWVLAEACRQTRRWQELYPSDPPWVVCVNISGVQLRYPELAKDVGRVLQETGLEPGSLDLEITEGILVENEPSNLATLRELKNLGVKLIIDDFGTGYSSLSYLKRLPADFLKIDRSFVEGLGKDPKDEGIVSAVIALARVLGMEEIAEGVETTEQATHLRELSCRFAQGYLFSKPLPAEGIDALLATRSS
ncbi:MAG TPA: EAL domain-containing protein [Rubrobacteraceae bacterium]|nr:EAL domain-containing protein [Rubrobacteraceae bacterium]